MKIIDFRLRPPAGAFLGTRIYSAPDNRNRYTRKLGYEPAPSAELQSMDLLKQEMDEAGISIGVVVARRTHTLGVITSAEAAEVAALDPRRFVAVGSVDPSNRKLAMQQIDDATRLGMKMINMEPGTLAEPLYVDDARLYPLYAKCEDEGMGVTLMCGGGAGPDITYSAPEHIDRVLRDFPDLKVVASHGNWPWVNEIIHIAWRRPNLYLSPDMYLRGLPGSREFLEAANGLLQDQFLFGTAYPFCPLKPYTDWFLSQDWKPDVLQKVLYDNAARLLGI